VRDHGAPANQLPNFVAQTRVLSAHESMGGVQRVNLALRLRKLGLDLDNLGSGSSSCSRLLAREVIRTQLMVRTSTGLVIGGTLSSATPFCSCSTSSDAFT
jgi:hypothetical protein